MLCFVMEGGTQVGRSLFYYLLGGGRLTANACGNISDRQVIR